MSFEISNPSQPSDFAELGRLMAQGFPSKCRHVGMNQANATNFWEKRWIEVNPECIGVVRDPTDSSKLLGMIVSKFHHSKLEYNSVPNPTSFYTSAKKVGFSLLQRIRVSKLQPLFMEQPSKDECYIVIICVSDSARGKGIGKALMEWAETLARAHKCKKMSLHVEATNRARHLYQRSGFRRSIIWPLHLLLDPICCVPVTGKLAFHFMKKSL